MKAKIFRLWCFCVCFIKLLFAWLVLHTFRRDLLKKNIWLIREKKNEARDNGYHFFKYLKENNIKVNAFYVITPDSADIYKLKKYGCIIKADGFKHCLYFLASSFSINSQPYGAYPFNFKGGEFKLIKKLCNRKQKVVFLQHGITKDKLPIDAFGYNYSNIDYFVTSTKREYDFVKNTYNYPDNSIGKVGMARFDNLYVPHIVENTLLVMPTWRHWLFSSEKKLPNDNSNSFCQSDYFRAYVNLLSDELLLQYLRDKKYKMTFFIHYAMQNYIGKFKSLENDVVTIADRNSYDVQDLLMRSKLLITDYSSVFFDFAYMNKPVIYFQFDKQQYRENHYVEGYFSYEDDGFGPCFERIEDMKQYIYDMVDNQCPQPEKYNCRVNEFFDLRDNHNCERIYNALKEIEEQKNEE